MRADRLLSLLLLLQTQGRTPAKRLAELLEVSERTIYRDLDALSAAGVPVYAERGPGGGCALVDSYRTTLTGLTEAEATALLMSGGPGPLADLGVSQALRAARLKLAAALPPGHLRDAERVRSRIHLDAAGWFRPEEPVPFLPTVQEALWQDRRLRLTYLRYDGSLLERAVDPLGLVAKASIWYLVAAAEGRIRFYRVSRVRAAEPMEEPCQRPAGFDLAAYWTEWCAQFEASRSRCTVLVRASPQAIAILPHMLGEGVRALIERAGPPDEEGWLRLALQFDSLDGACGCLLGFGTTMEVLEPPELRESMVAVAADVVRFYRGEGH